MVDIALFQTDIAQNFGTMTRTAVCLGVPVHVIEPLGFIWNEAKMRRAGMDYLDRAEITRHKSWQDFQKAHPKRRLVALSTKGATHLSDFTFKDDDILLFGRESAGLPDEVMAACDGLVRIPMVAGERSLNVSQSCAMALYKALENTHKLPIQG